MIDYDLVILGGTEAGRIAAMTAVGYGARVALVEPPGLFEQNQRQRYLLQGLQQLGEGRSRQGVARWFQRSPQAAEPVTNELDWQTILEWSAIAAQTQSAALSPAVMNDQGIDVVLAMPERLSRQLVITVAQRQLRARGVLADFGTVPIDLSTLLTAQRMPATVSIQGGSPLAVLWAEALASLGADVTLIAEQFLPDEDEDIQAWVRSQLITTGVSILQPADRVPLPTADCTLCLSAPQPALHLPNFVYHPNQSVLSANRHLQTAHPRIFACGTLVNGFSGRFSARYEMPVAVRNALFLPTSQVNYAAIPMGYHRFGRVGLTQAQAQRRYGNVRVWIASSANSADLSQANPLPIYCKLVCVKHRLLGIHLVGDGAQMLVQVLALALNQPISSLSQTLPLNDVAVHDLADLVRIAAEKSRQIYWQPHHWRRDWVENWFNWRRSQ